MQKRRRNPPFSFEFIATGYIYTSVGNPRLPENDALTPVFLFYPENML